MRLARGAPGQHVAVGGRWRPGFTWLSQLCFISTREIISMNKRYASFCAAVLLVVSWASAQTFTEVASARGLAMSARVNGVAWGDYDKDGDEDLLLCIAALGVRLYPNNGSGTFGSAYSFP